MKISIITTTYNSTKTIEDTIKSVLGQVGVEIEYIIIDGGSTDGTLDIIKCFGDRVAKVVSEPDGGMYEAMNKGIKLATGDIVGILNSDDFYASGEVLKMVADKFAESGADCIWGDLVYIDKNDLNKVVRDWKSSSYKAGLFQKGWHPPHPTLFVKKSVYEKYGVFRTDLSTAADYELMLRFLEKNKISSAYIPQLLVKMRAGGESNKSYYNLIRANWYCYKAFGLNGLKINPLFILKKPWFKRHQF
jgi:glycosyltransferase involved in cell wall biosynthesis